ncbi:hypothetical protein F183_A16010 [Bryobacterales bacterium F-183]|nr:hypothetical protein F183_A16010 [Bryobacterales bacterium F-183]
MRFLRIAAILLALTAVASAAAKTIRAGAAQVNINPTSFPVIINCGFLERTGKEMNGDLFARAIVIEEGSTRIAIAVVDSCMMMRELIDDAKAQASAKTGIPVNRMLISATHTHSAPAAMACLGSRQQKDYAAALPAKIAEAIAAAHAKLQPAKIGAASIDAPNHTFTRRWIYQPTKMLTDPFGEVSVRANMIPGFENPNVIAPSGPVDSELSVVSIQSTAGQPIAVLANFGNHYFGSSGVSPDYFGIFDTQLAQKIGGNPVVMMSQGTSGDANTANYAKPKATWTITEYATQLVDLALTAYRRIQYTPGVPLRMEEALLPLGRRVASRERLEWAEKTAKAQKTEVPANQPEVYAHEQLFLRDTPKRELKLQAIRLGDIAITAIPNEVYALTGLKLKTQSPLPRTINIELANGAEGYIPPPEQHLFGGYTTWAARSAGLETTAEPKIVETLLTLLEKTAGWKRKPVPTRSTTVATKPFALWPLDDMYFGPAVDAIGRNPGKYTGRVAMFSAGPTPETRSAYFAGGTFEATVKNFDPAAYTLQFWLWAGIPTSPDAAVLKLNGTSVNLPLDVPAKTWHQVAVVQRNGQATLYIDGQLKGSVAVPKAIQSIQMGHGFEGRISDVALYARAKAPN